MIKLDQGGEEFVFENEWDTAVPITVRKKDGCETVVEVFPSYEREAEEFLRLFSDDPFTPAALDFIYENIGTKMTSRGYEEEEYGKFRHRFYYTYAVTSREQINKNAILPSTLPLTKKNIRFKKNKTTFDLPLYIDEEMTAFITVSGKEIVSIASENRSFSDDFADEGTNVIEIGTETHIDHRKNGYAASNCAALADKLMSENDCIVTYETANTNISSQKCAEKAGFVRYGRCYYYIMRKTYKDND